MGCADIAVRRMLPALTTLPGVRAVAVASRERARAESVAARFGCRPVHGYPALLRRADIDAVYVPLPAALHAPWVRAALLAGKHVLAEKPMAMDGPGTAVLQRIAGSRGLVLMENVMFVHHRQQATVRRMIAAGVVGRVRAFRATFTIPRLPDHDIRYRADLGGGALTDVGVYPVRAALHFLGADLTVVESVLARGAGRRVDTSGTVRLRSGGGVGVQLSFGLEHPYRSAYEFLGSLGCLRVERAFTPPADHRPVVHLDLGRDGRDVVLDPDDQVANTLNAFAAAVDTGLVPGTADSLRQAELLDEVRRAQRPAR